MLSDDWCTENKRNQISVMMQAYVTSNIIEQCFRWNMTEKTVPRTYLTIIVNGLEGDTWNNFRDNCSGVLSEY